MPRMHPLGTVAWARAMEMARALTVPPLCTCRCHSRAWDCCSRISTSTLGSCHPPHGRRRHSHFDSSKQSSSRRSCLRPHCRHPHPRNPDLASGWLSMCLETERATEMETAKEELAANTTRRTSHRRRGIAWLADCMVAKRQNHSNKNDNQMPPCSSRSSLGSQCNRQCNTIRILPNPSCTHLAQNLRVQWIGPPCGSLVCG